MDAPTRGDGPPKVKDQRGWTFRRSFVRPAQACGYSGVSPIALVFTAFAYKKALLWVGRSWVGAICSNDLACLSPSCRTTARGRESAEHVLALSRTAPNGNRLTGHFIWR